MEGVDYVVTAVIENETELTEPAVALWAPGSVILVSGEDASAEAALAMWQVSPDGYPTGAWVVAEQDARVDASIARRLLLGVERRAVVVDGSTRADDFVSKLTSVAGFGSNRWWTGQRLSPIDAFGDVLARRAELDPTVDAIRRGGRTVAPLQWDDTFSTDARPATVAELMQLAKTAVPEGAPVVAEALRLSRLLRWLVALWARTEQVKNRRDYLRDKHGEPEALPPDWMAAVQTASATRLPL